MKLKKYEKQICKLKIKLSLFEVLTLIYVLAAAKKKLIIISWRAGLMFKKDSSNLFNKPLFQAVLI